jgi:hypothetical protein
MGKLDMKDYVLNEKPEPASNNEIVWAFDLGKGSIGHTGTGGNLLEQFKQTA